MKSILSVAFIALLIVFSGCRKPVLPNFNDDNYQEIKFTAGGGDGSKGSFEETEEYTLIYKWTSTDKIYVYAIDNEIDPNRECFAGVLDNIKIFGDSKKASFHGRVKIPAGTKKLRFVHYGSKIEINSDGSAICDMSSQDGVISSNDPDISSISSMVVGYKDFDCSASGIYGDESIGAKLETIFAIMKFDLSDFSGNVNMSGIVNNKIRITDKGVIEPIAGSFSTLKNANSLYYAAFVEKTDETTIKFSDANRQGSMTLLDGVLKNKFYHGTAGVALHIGASVIDALPGVFSVGEGKTVHFSKGNLKCNTNQTYWKYEFEENQWGFPAIYDASHVGHFFWSSNGNASGDGGYGAGSAYVSIVPLSTSNVVNWGVTINSSIWRTLSKEEWWYLLRTRDESLLKYKDFGDGIKGYILLPDNALGSAPTIFSSINNVSNLATYQAVFLPDAGYRSGVNVDLTQNTAYYWSNTAYSGEVSGSYSETDFAWGFLLKHDGSSVTVGVGGQFRSAGYSVRLVCE